MTRRQLLQAGAVAGAGLLAPPGISAAAARGPAAGQQAMFTEQLPTLAELGVLDMRGGGRTALWVRNASHRFQENMGPANTLAYQEAGSSRTYLGPVIIARKGVPFELKVRNAAECHPLASAIDSELIPRGSNDAKRPRTSVHLHGGNVSPQSDGGPDQAFAPGDSYTYHYGNNQEAAGLWYHDHALGMTRLNVYAGLAGSYLLRDGIDTGDGTQLPPPPYEVPLIIQDKMFNPDGTLAYPPNPDLKGPDGAPRPWAPEFFGDVATVNGKVRPNLDVARGRYRFRVFNGSNARFYDFTFDAGGPALAFYQIGSDGGLLNAPVRLDRLVIGPGERADLVVDFAGLRAGSRVVLRNSARVPYPDGPESVAGGAIPLPQVMQFTVTSRTGYTVPLPARLRDKGGEVTSLREAAPAKIRRMALVEVANTDGVPVMALLNNRMFDSPDTTEVEGDTLEQWELINTTEDAHPIHLHFTQFQVLNRQKFHADAYLEETGYIDPATGLVTPGRGKAVEVERFLIGRPRDAAANEQGWKDTVVALPGEVTRIRVPFGAGAAGGKPLAIGSSFKGDYVWHCHILEHEDNDMMQRYTIK
ncbi:multicopper oxidase family protein [Pseudarthrobacter niigatensis]|uniref:FtsP/CotA-like multicopper oxidase with cupredoxin domain n=1 Tax=Pseudarthrobacter niigatensis TaxID=369935 RepID=A0AAJ1WHC5_9MICC|nr:multicopper oxidase domain-containing protein [Pseudarthrobacter niigatensis]MDQ0147645.1 FtsP/CotA-like multicopper oxidase with cupredoxin domain [Pseudarthrobacter niigatensis]MDQ0267574.1 FtsP/CotA-like multicopper oxidase with cupredoxin domain [Pseudarthrobacter niigatensis]